MLILLLFYGFPGSFPIRTTQNLKLSQLSDNSFVIFYLISGKKCRILSFLHKFFFFFQGISLCFLDETSV
ncbi:hypothetical protein D7Y06_22025 [Roseburia sp. 1XD42-69]|nr:hypothetical protein D7Y06_22025 [Roseburia sp. 1XD42-69]